MQFQFPTQQLPAFVLLKSKRKNTLNLHAKIFCQQVTHVYVTEKNLSFISLGPFIRLNVRELLSLVNCRPH